MNLTFQAISELSKPSAKWLQLYNTHWAAYKAWLSSKGASNSPDLATCEAALETYMPEMVATYKHCCQLVKADGVAARFLTGYQPPAYISACAQAVNTQEKIQLVRNYDYHPNLMEGTLILTKWHQKKVMGVGDCLLGLVDGINEDGLVVSLTFGGRKEVGKGFGIPFIIRYVLEFCSDVTEAVAALCRIPTHMSYNVMVTDKTGLVKTVRMAPDREPVVTDDRFATNHQGEVDWPENAQFNKTLERAAYLQLLLEKEQLSNKEFADQFLQKPLYNTLFKEGFGTCFTSVYTPEDGTMQMRWPDDSLSFSFQDFKEQSKTIYYAQGSALDSYKTYRVPKATPVAADAYAYDWQSAVAGYIADAVEQFLPEKDAHLKERLKEKLLSRGQISWEILADYWSKKY